MQLGDGYYKNNEIFICGSSSFSYISFETKMLKFLRNTMSTEGAKLAAVRPLATTYTTKFSQIAWSNLLGNMSGYGGVRRQNQNLQIQHGVQHYECKLTGTIGPQVT
jgi:hypothetical protein